MNSVGGNQRAQSTAATTLRERSHIAQRETTKRRLCEIREANRSSRASCDVAEAAGERATFWFVAVINSNGASAPFF